jgi:hypothetical protein
MVVYNFAWAEREALMDGRFAPNAVLSAHGRKVGCYQLKTVTENVRVNSGRGSRHVCFTLDHQTSSARSVVSEKCPIAGSRRALFDRQAPASVEAAWSDYRVNRGWPLFTNHKQVLDNPPQRWISGKHLPFPTNHSACRYIGRLLRFGARHGQSTERSCRADI